jgi:hypothetical protein
MPGKGEKKIGEGLIPQSLPSNISKAESGCFDRPRQS